MKASSRRRPALSEQKTALLREFSEVRAAILAAASEIPPDRVVSEFVGSWNILDLLAHLRGWDATNLDAAQDILRGKLPDLYAEYDKNWASYNARLVARYREADLDTMIRLTRASHAELLAYLEQLTTEQLLTDQGVRHGKYKVIISRLIAAETKDEVEHLEQIQRFVTQAR